MNSINRIESGKSSVMRTKSKISMSFKSRIITTFNFTDCRRGDLRAISSERMTASCPDRRVIISNLKGSRVSRLATLSPDDWSDLNHATYLRLRWVSPLSIKAGSLRCKATPLLVIAIAFNPWFRSSPSRPGISSIRTQHSGWTKPQAYTPTSSTMPFLIVGSPPVNRIFVIPQLTKRDAKRMTSSSERILGPGLNSTPSLGIQ